MNTDYVMSGGVSSGMSDMVGGDWAWPPSLVISVLSCPLLFCVW